MDARWTLGQWTKRQDTGWEKAAPWYSAAAHSCQSLLSKGHKGLLQQNLKPVQVGKAMAKQWVGRRSILKGRERGVRGRPGTIALKDVSGGRGKTWQVLKKMGAAVSFWAVFLTTLASSAVLKAGEQDTRSLWEGITPALVAIHNGSLEQCLAHTYEILTLDYLDFNPSSTALSAGPLSHL